MPENYVVYLGEKKTPILQSHVEAYKWLLLGSRDYHWVTNEELTALTVSMSSADLEMCSRFYHEFKARLSPIIPGLTGPYTVKNIYRIGTEMTRNASPVVFAETAGQRMRGWERTGVPFRFLLVFLFLLLAGCGQKVKEAPPFQIIATDSGFEAPGALAAGIRHIVYENRGSKIHEAMLVRLAKGMTPDDYAAEVKKGELFPKGALDYSGPGLTSPGLTAEMWLKVDPGHYVLICWNNGHAKTITLHPFTVEEVRVPDNKPPKEDVVIRLLDYRFELSRPLRKGTQVIRVETPGPSMHELDFFRLKEGQTSADVRRWSMEEVRDQAPFDALGGALDSHDTKRAVWLRKEFTPGRYVLHCEMPVANSKLTHADLGMTQEIEIK